MEGGLSGAALEGVRSRRSWGRGSVRALLGGAGCRDPLFLLPLLPVTVNSGRGGPEEDALSPLPRPVAPQLSLSLSNILTSPTARRRDMEFPLFTARKPERHWLGVSRPPQNMDP